MFFPNETKMKRQLANYIVTPKIVLAGAETEITIKPLGTHAMFKEEKYQVMFIPMCAAREPEHDYDLVQVRKSDDGFLRVKYAFSGEQEYLLRLYNEDVKLSAGKDYWTNKDKMLNCFNVYSLFEDLYTRRPYKGDFHAHSNCSDGKECPEINAANYRKGGFDFYSLTDHHRYWPSVQCKAYYDAKPVDFRVFHGEEVHSPGNHVHIINCGGRYSVNEIYEKDREAYEREVKQIQDTVTYPEGFDHSRDFFYAACLWVFRKIREAGGLAILAHPHWNVDTYNVADNLTDAMFRSGEFDAFELVGGQSPVENNMQIAFYNDKCSNGIKLPIVGSSDSHGTEEGDPWFKWFYTVVFSKGLELEDIKEAVLSGYSSAVDKYPGSEARVHGSYRMSLYTRFLLNEYFPLHEELCFEEGRYMKAMFLGDSKAEELLTQVRGRADALLKQYWGK
jgi:hypothetical protein